MAAEDLSEIQRLLKEAEGAMSTIIERVKVTQAEIDGNSTTQEDGDRD